MSLPIINGVGRLTEDPSLKFTPNGKAVVTLRIAFSDRKKDDQGNWSDGDKAYLDASVWGDEAERIAEGLTRGCEVLVSGKLKQREYTTREGEKRTVFEIAFATVAPTLKWASVTVRKADRSGGSGVQPAQSSGGNFDDPWSTSAGNGPGRVQDNEVPF